MEGNIHRWPVQVPEMSMLAQWLAGTAQNSEQCLIQGKHCSATAKPSVCYQHYFHTDSKAELSTYC